jgi:hypothetical protein
MKTKRAVIVGLAMIVPTVVAGALVSAGGGSAETPGLVQHVRESIGPFRDVDQAMAAGYMSLGSCVSSPEEGAMGIHYANGDLLGDGALVPDQPELVIYEQRGGRPRLVGVEFLVLVDAWTAAGNTGPPVLLGQHFQFVNAPNRYGLPPFYELHVWAFKNNRLGMFADFNPAVSCEEYTGEPGATGTH